jgi:tetratricopeptide (TPR) repeat protein
MCLGESTTADQYPPFLEEILNQHNIGVKFSVIDKGIRGIDSIGILSNLEENLNIYKPNMIITMMGVNDNVGVVPYGGFQTPKAILLLKSFRTYKLARLLWLHIATKIREIGSYKPKELSKLQPSYFSIELGQLYQQQNKLPEAEEIFKKAIALNPNNNWAYLELGQLYQEQNRLPEAEEIFKKAIALNPNNNWAYLELGELYQQQNTLPEAEEIFKKAIALNPNNNWAYLELGQLYQQQNKLPEAEESFKKVIALNPKNDRAYVGLGLFYQQQNRLLEAEEIFKKAIAINPNNNWAYLELEELYQYQNKLPEAEEFLKKLITSPHENNWAYLELGQLYQEQNRLLEAEELFKKAIAINPNNNWAYLELGELYRQKGRFPEAEELLKKVVSLTLNNGNIKDRGCRSWGSLYNEINKIGLSREYSKKVHYAFSPLTIVNYHRLKTILDKRRIRLVCAQYPLRSVEPLKRIFEGEQGVIFVGNERVFKEVVTREGYLEYFRDMFAGDFGHCTTKGNRLLAENIANVILKEVFGK